MPELTKSWKIFSRGVPLSLKNSAEFAGLGLGLRAECKDCRIAGSRMLETAGAWGFGFSIGARIGALPQASQADGTTKHLGPQVKRSNSL